MFAMTDKRHPGRAVKHSKQLGSHFRVKLRIVGYFRSRGHRKEKLRLRPVFYRRLPQSLAMTIDYHSTPVCILCQANGKHGCLALRRFSFQALQRLAPQSDRRV